MFQGIFVIIAFFVFAVLMYKQKISTFLALISMSVIIGLVAGIPVQGKEGMLVTVFDAGSTMLAAAMVAVVFGAWLGEVMNETGITKDIIRRSAELGGDRPVVLAIAMSAAVAILFTALTGLGAVIMVGTLVLPILNAAGIRPVLAGTIFLFSRVIGNLLNLATWAVFVNVTKLPADLIKDFAIIVAGITAVGVLIFILVELREKRIAWSLGTQNEFNPSQALEKVPTLALLTPLIPFPLVIWLKWPFVPALLVGCLFGVLTTKPKDALRVLTKAMHEGLKSAAPAVILMISIGFILKTVAHPDVSKILLDVMKPVLPQGPFSFFLFFALLSPLALYRGPLNVYGLGSGMIGLLIAVNTIPPLAVVAGFLAAMVIQLAGDPTNTHNVWTSDFLGLEVNDITRKSLPYLWAVSIIAIIVATFIYF